MECGGLADNAGLNHFHRTAQAVARAALVAHLRDDLLLGGEQAQVACFGDRVRERLLHVGVLAHLHGEARGWRVDVVGRGDDDGVEALAHLLVELAVVTVALRLRVFFEAFAQRVAVHIAERDDVRAALRTFVGVTGALAARTDDGDIHLVV